MPFRWQWADILKYSDVVVAVAVIFMVVMMVIPLPARLLDVLLAFNLTFALVVLLVTMYTREPLQFSIFPSLLLITTLFRLALNVSSTRLILLHGYAGEIILAFGQFVVGGNPVVGFIIFCILVVIQFVVITRGAERVAEVAARFTLDAMPGKQMSIDADLNAGLITEQEARSRRREIEQEADFYGAMDGASKFVKGDAIAGMLITLINLLGGLGVGVFQRGLPAAEAVQKYSLLTVGDGLVSQIPALLVSTATGIVVTRAASDSNLGQDLTRQVLAQPRVLAVAAGVLGFFALVPGLPYLPFLVLAGLAGTAAAAVQRRRHDAAAAESWRDRDDEVRRMGGPESVMPLIQVDPLEVELGIGLIPLADVSQGGDLLERVVMVRRQMALELGVVVPPVRIRDNMQLEPGQYAIKLKGARVGEGELLLDHYLAMGKAEEAAAVQGVPARDPVFGLEAIWVSRSGRHQAELAGYTVVEPSAVLATHLTELIRTHAGELLGRQETKNLLNAVKETHPAVVEDLVPDVLSLGEVQKVLQNLLREGIPIRDLVSIMETLADYGRVTRDTDLLTEYTRRSLRRSIAARFGLERRTVQAITLSPEAEEVMGRGLKEGGDTAQPVLEPGVMDALLRSLATQMKRAMERGVDPLVLCSPRVRLPFRRLSEQVAPRVPVLSYLELDPRTRVESIGTVSLHEGRETPGNDAS